MNVLKSLYCILLFPLLISSITSIAQTTDILSSKDSAKLYKPFINTIREKVVFKELPDYSHDKPPLFISKQQALEDIEMIRYIIDNAFSGRDYWQSRGIDFNSLYNKLVKITETSKDDKVSTAEIEDIIFNHLSSINDGHTVIVGFKQRELVQNLIPYYSEIIIEKKGDKFIVISSNQADVKSGTEYKDSKHFLFKTISGKGSEQFLIGKQSTKNINALSIKFESGTASLNLHPSRIGNLSFENLPNLFEIDTISIIPVVRSSSFSNTRDEKHLKQFMDAGKWFKDKPVFIWNIMDNRGGDGYFPGTFIENFNTVSQEDASILTLHSPVINQCYWKGKNSWLPWPESVMKGLRDDNYPLDSIPSFKREKIRGIRQEKPFVKSNPIKYWEVEPQPKRKPGNYKGKVIILSNHFTNSAGNNAIAASKSIPNSLVIGENSGSAYTFSNVKYYCLKHSKIKLWFPSMLIINPYNQMERGFLPDYWLDSDKPIEEVTKWLSNPDSYQFHYNK